MVLKFYLSILQELSPQSHVYIGELQRVVDVSSMKTVETLEDAVRGHLKSCREFKFWGEGVNPIDFVIHKVR